MKALILAAGTGSRLLKITRDLPKALVEVKGKPLVRYTLDFAESIGCDRITVVGGFYFEKLQDFLKRQPGEPHLIRNKEFLKGSILTLVAGLEGTDEAILLMNVDHIFPLAVARRFSESRSGLHRISAFVDFDRPLDEDDMKVELDVDRRIRRISKGLHVCDAGYIGMTYVPREKLDIYARAAAVVRERNEEAVVEEVLQEIVDMGEEVGILDMSGIRWLEIDNQSDLLNAERILEWVPGFLD